MEHNEKIRKKMKLTVSFLGFSVLFLTVGSVGLAIFMILYVAPDGSTSGTKLLYASPGLFLWLIWYSGFVLAKNIYRVESTGSDSISKIRG